MTMRELINEMLYEVKDQDQEIDIDDVIGLIGLWNRHIVENEWYGTETWAWTGEED